MIWERWTHHNEGELLIFVMVTVPANKLIYEITDRMPAIAKPEDWGKWLGDEAATADDLKSMLVPFEGDWIMQPEKSKPTKPPKRPPPEPQPTLF